MAALTADRIGRVEKRFPVPVDHPFELGADQVIYAGSLFVVANDGKAYNINSNFTTLGVTPLRVLYAPSHLERGVASPHMHEGGGDVPVGEGVSGIEVYLDATGLTQADTNKVCYASDDHTVTVTAGTGAFALPVGRIQHVMSATYAQVFVDGKTRDVNTA